MLRIAFVLSLFLGLAGYGTRLTAQDQVEGVRRAKIMRLIDQLGDASFRVRENANRELLEIGIDAKEALTAGLNRPELEIRRRCSSVLPQIIYRFCLERSRSLLGETAEAQKFFDEMYSSESELWIAFAFDSPELGKKYVARCSELSKGPPTAAAIAGKIDKNLDWTRFELTERSLAALLIIGAEARTKVPADSLRAATKLFERKWGKQYAKDTPALLRKVYVTWAEEIGNLPVEYEGAKMLEVLRGLLASKSVPASEKQYSLLALAKINERRDYPLIASFLSDATVCDTLFAKGVKFQVQLRDVALAAVIYRAGENPKVFGYNSLRFDANILYAPSSLGFPSEADRAAAFSKWNVEKGQRSDRGSPVRMRELTTTSQQ